MQVFASTELVVHFHAAGPPLSGSTQSWTAMRRIYLMWSLLDREPWVLVVPETE